MVSIYLKLYKIYSFAVSTFRYSKYIQIRISIKIHTLINIILYKRHGEYMMSKGQHNEILNTSTKLFYRSDTKINRVEIF